jgi:hypothetical protein
MTGRLLTFLAKHEGGLTIYRLSTPAIQKEADGYQGLGEKTGD